MNPLAQIAHSLARYIHIMHLFTVDLVQPVIIPWTFVGICDALADTAVTDQVLSHPWHIMIRAPAALGWVWLGMLTFAVGNQRAPDAIQEDKINKPWRVIPSGRLSVDQARLLHLYAVFAYVAAGTYLGAGHITCLFVVLTHVYNDMGGADLHWLLRNLINGAAIAVASAGATTICLSNTTTANNTSFSFKGQRWILIQAAIGMTTIQVQDLRDRDGDKARKRSTMPVDLGDELARWSIMLTVMPWSLFCPSFWSVDFIGTSIVVLLGGYLSFRVMFWRRFDADKRSWRIWGIWTLAVFALPLYSQWGLLYKVRGLAGV